MTYSLHAIVLPPEQSGFVKVFFGKGQQSDDAVRSRLLPEHGAASIVLGRAIESRAELAVKMLILIEQLRVGFPSVRGHWYTMPPQMVPLMIEGAMSSSSVTTDFHSSAEGIAEFRAVVGVDMSVMSAMMGIERTRVHRLEQGKSKLTFEDYRRLRIWAHRLSLTGVFNTCFPLQAKHPPVEDGPPMPEVPSVIQPEDEQ